MKRTVRFMLRNGLRVVIERTTATAALAVSVHYGVGFRSEPPGRSGFAHLFEHLMFQGSTRYPKMEHWRYVQELGGTVNGSTHQDYTDFHQLVPPGGLETVLAMEADRMVGLILTEENLATQRSVVKEEIRLNVLNRAYGGFPWIPLPALLYQTYANTHNGYGEFEDLDSATVNDASDFYRKYYGPGNAVLTIAGEVDPEAAAALVERHFGGLPANKPPVHADVREQIPAGTVHGTARDVHAPLPALAIGYVLPDQAGHLESYAGHMVLCELLAGGPSSLLHKELVRTGLAVGAAARCGLFAALDCTWPDTLSVVLTHRSPTEGDALLAAFDKRLAQLDELIAGTRHVAVAGGRVALRLRRRGASPLTRVRTLGAGELLHGDPERTDTLVRSIESLTVEPSAVEPIAAAGLALRDGGRAVLALQPGAAPKPARLFEGARA